MSTSRKNAASSSFASSSKPQKRGKHEFDLAGGEEGGVGDEEDLEEAKSKKGKVKAEGYDSDSSDDGEGVVNSRKPGAKGAGDDSDDDMFGDAKPTDAKGKAKASDPLKKGDKFLSLGEIEGQEFGKGDDEGDESDDSKDGMGYELSSFNMKNELKEGAFTEEGAYVQSAKDPMEMHDRWLEGVEDKGVMRRAREAKARRDREEEEKKQREVDELRDGSGKGREDLVREIADMLEPGETVLLGLQRLGGGGGSKDKGKEKATGGKKLSWVERQKERKKAMAEAATASSSSGGGMDVDSTTLPASSSADPSIPSTPFDRLSTITTDLTAMGQLDLYSMSREALQRLLPRPPPPQQSAPPLDDGTSYEYRFSMDHLRSLPEAERPVEREVFGPFPRPSILQWRAQGFFGGLGGVPEKVELRKVGGGDWKSFWDLFG